MECSRSLYIRVHRIIEYGSWKRPPRPSSQIHLNVFRRHQFISLLIYPICIPPICFQKEIPKVPEQGGGWGEKTSSCAIFILELDSFLLHCKSEEMCILPHHWLLGVNSIHWRGGGGDVQNSSVRCIRFASNNLKYGGKHLFSLLSLAVYRWKCASFSPQKFTGNILHVRGNWKNVGCWVDYLLNPLENLPSYSQWLSRSIVPTEDTFRFSMSINK